MSIPIRPPLPDTSAHRRRVDLHARADAASRIVSPSQVAYIRGRQQRWTEPELAEIWTAAVEDCRDRMAASRYFPITLQFQKIALSTMNCF